MSYTRKYRESITVPYRGQVSYNYPASENGGSGTAYYDGEINEDINVEIDIDTNPFDRSVAQCNNRVRLLTGSVVASESAQIISIKDNSKKVANTIIGGFFGYIRSEISQQIAEISTGIDSQLMYLAELSKEVQKKKVQMENDFGRISSRYLNIFEDLNKELSNRIGELDKSAFSFRKQLDNHTHRQNKTDLVNTVTVSAMEGGELQAKMSASFAKNRALDSIYKAKRFLFQQRVLDETIHKSMHSETVEQEYFSPSCFVETKGEKGQSKRTVHISEFISKDRIKVKEDLNKIYNATSCTWENISKNHLENLKLHFSSEMNKLSQNNDKRSKRVRQIINSLADLNSIKTNNKKID